MPTANSLNSARVNFWILGSGIIVCLFLHLAALSQRPGLHFDEAWAMNYSWRIASEQGFWPWRAMSPYTFPVAHYWAAAWLKLFGPSLFIFRLSQVALSLGGIFFVTHELMRAGYGRAAAFLPWAVVFVPGLLLNHRFAIELNGVHPFLFAILLSAVLRGKAGRAGICFVVATMAHILFYGVGLGFIAACLWNRRKFSGREYRALSVAALALAVFFLRVLVSIPEHGKAAALLLSALAIPVVTFPRFPLPDWRPRWLPWLAAAVFLFNLVFFAEGQWSLAIFYGMRIYTPLLVEALLFMGFLAWLGRLGAKEWPPLFRSWFLWAVFFIGLMMLKPAPRYFELPLLALAVALAFGMVQLELGLVPSPRRALATLESQSAILPIGPLRKWVPSFVFLCAHAAVVLLAFFTLPGVEREQHMLFFKDSSRDFLNKQMVAHFLGENGCRLDQVKLPDARVAEALRALSLGDWPVQGTCTLPGITVRRRVEAVGLGNGDISDFVLE